MKRKQTARIVIQQTDIMKKIKYSGETHYFDGIYNVNAVIHNGEPIGNGEINNSGANMYVCHADGDMKGTCWLFRENEIEHIK